MRVTFLGTGAGEGVPTLWCTCETCEHARRHGGRDVRHMTALLVNNDLLIDAGQTVLTSSARLGIDLSPVQALLVTHPHGDHFFRDSLERRARHWGGLNALPLLTVYASRAVLGLMPCPEPLRLALRPISPFERLVIDTGGYLDPDPRVPGEAVPQTPPRRYEVWPLAAQHAGPADEAMLFAIRQVRGPEVDGNHPSGALLYATDTAAFPPVTWSALEELAEDGLRFGATVVDATLGTRPVPADVSAHMTTSTMIEHQEELARRGLLATDARRLAVHFSHYFNPPHDELATMLRPHGIEPAYDGLTFTLK